MLRILNSGRVHAKILNLIIELKLAIRERGLTPAHPVQGRQTCMGVISPDTHSGPTRL